MASGKRLKKILVYNAQKDTLTVRYSKYGLKDYLASKSFKTEPYLIDYYLGIHDNAGKAAKLRLPSLSEIRDKLTGKQKEEEKERQYDVFSSNLEQVRYSPTEEILRIIFKSGGIYQYYGVPVEIFDRLLAANSKGKFFHQFIKDEYKYDKLR